MRREGASFVAEVPPEAGRVIRMTVYENLVILACENGVYLVTPAGTVSKLEPCAVPRIGVSWQQLLDSS